MLDLTKAAVLAVACEQIANANKEGGRRYGEGSRVVSQTQELAFRLCHQDHFGLSKTDAAEIIGVSIRRLYELLAEMRLNAPQVFPILPPKIARVYRMFVQDHMTVAEIAEETGTGPRNIQMMLRTLYDDRARTGLYFPEGETRRLTYCEWMDSYVAQKW